MNCITIIIYYYLLYIYIKYIVYIQKKFSVREGKGVILSPLLYPPLWATNYLFYNVCRPQAMSDLLDSRSTCQTGPSSQGVSSARLEVTAVRLADDIPVLQLADGGTR